MNVKRQSESGNALVYVLIAIALFAALSMTLGRQTDTSEANSLSDEKAELLATQLISYAAQATSVVDQMILSSTPPPAPATTEGLLEFELPTDAAFNTAPHTYKVYHPEGGGLNPANIPDKAISQVSTNPVAGWYMGRFNNVEWTESTDQDIILTAHQINPQVCAKINEKVNGSTNIPTLTVTIKDVLISTSYHAGPVLDLTTDDPGDICPDCDGINSLCVKSNGAEEYAFYTVLANQ